MSTDRPGTEAASASAPADNVVSLKPAADSPAAGHPAHIVMKLPQGCFVHSAGDYHVIQFLIGPADAPEPTFGLAAVHRWTGAVMPQEEMEILAKPSTPQEEAGKTVLLDKAGRPMSGVKDAPIKLAKAGPSMLSLLRDHPENR